MGKMYRVKITVLRRAIYPDLAKEYLSDPDSLAPCGMFTDGQVFDADGFLHTGDMGRFEEDGSVVIVGRKKEMYIRGGENVYPPEIEDVICRHPDVMLAAVIGRPHEKWGEVGRAYIMPKPGKNPSPEEIKEFLKDKLSNFKIPEDIIVRPMLPLTPLGKVKKLDLYKEMKQELGK